MKQSIKSSLLHVLAAAILVAMPMHQAQSAPGTLPTSPLYLSTIVEPNVFLTLDDSFSMVSEYSVALDQPGFSTIIIDDGSLQREGAVWINGSYRLEFNPLFFNPEVVPPASSKNVGAVVLEESWVLRNYEVNKLYYNPSINYIPWPGTDAAGNALYSNVPESAPAGQLSVQYAPFFAESWSGFTNIIKDYAYDDLTYSSSDYYMPTYYTATDSNGNGVIDAADTHKLYEIRNDGGSYPSGRDYIGEIENFANWWVYYRTRELLTKATIGKIINNSDSNRMGLRAFNAGHIIDAATMSDPANKLALLKAFYVTPSTGQTPARTALDEVGQMFAGTNKLVATPILPSTDGGTCQQNYNILMSDSYWNGAVPTYGTGKPDFFNTDFNKDASIFDGDASESNDQGNYADNYENTLADVAMHYYETDLSAMADEVPAREGVDLNTQQHLVNYTLSFGLEGSLDQSIAPTDTVTPFAGWTDPTASGKNKIDDMWHAAYNSRGGIMSASNSAELESELSQALTSITEISGTVTASVAVNSAKLSTSSTIYLASFFSAFWDGDLSAFLIKDLNTGELFPDSEWEAAAKLTSRIASFGYDNGNRPIITYDPDTGIGLPFVWTGLTAKMQADFSTSPSGTVDGNGESRFNYFRGDRDFEGTSFRVRETLLGDIVNSSPVYVGPPNLAWPDAPPFETGTNAYSTFKTTQKDRKSILYVGANDGMLHAFSDDGDNDPNNGIANGGEELFAYVPGLLYSSGTANKGLHYLSDPNYIHNFYVDLTPTVSDIFYGGNWHTVLVGGLRGGGRGLFALDVTDPGTFGATAAKSDAMSLWEFTSANDPDLGYTFARPTIGLSNKPDTWVAIFGNGYNSDDGIAKLFIVNIEAGLDGWDKAAGDWTTISTGVGAAGAKNGLAAPALADIDGNGTIDRAYAGDLEGNMWVFDLSGATESKWLTAGAKRLFTAPANQKITAKPVIAKHPTVADSNNNDPNIMVFFGTGQYLVSGDKVTTDIQSFYGVWDNSSPQVLTQLDLIEQTFDASFTTGRVLTRNPVDYASDSGWYFDLPDSGERSVTSPIARADTVFFNTFVPSDAPCERGGYGFRFAVDMGTGGSPQKPTIDTNGDGVIDDNDYQSNGVDQSTLAAVRQEGFLPEPVFIEDLAFTGETAAKIKALSTVPSGRFSWQELIF